MSPNELNQPIYIKSKQLCARFGVSAMWLRRRMADAGFPQPVHFGTSERFWKLDEVEAWEAAQKAKGEFVTRRAFPSRFPAEEAPGK
jgi:predicted DNA-binding transcriptional regulator AlpA